MSSLFSYRSLALCTSIFTLATASTAQAPAPPAATDTVAPAKTTTTAGGSAKEAKKAADASVASPDAKDSEQSDFPIYFVKGKHPTFASEIGGVKFALEVRAEMKVRGELVGPNSLEPDFPKIPVAHRLRLGTTFSAGPHLRIVTDLQDVRSWGAELPLPGKPADPTLFGYSGGGIDFHQAYLGLKWFNLDLRVGRQEIALDGQRLMGAVNWTMQGRSFDAARLSFKGGAHAVNGFAALVRDGDFSTPDLEFPHSGIVGLHYIFSGLDFLKFAPALFVDYQGPLDRVRVTTGVRANGGILGIGYDVEAYYQGVRDQNDLTHAALLAGRVGYTLKSIVTAKVEIFADLLSGDTDTASTHGLSSFDTLYGTNHKFYGFQDLFLAIPKHTKGRGLADVGTTAVVKYSRYSIRLDLHLMSATDLGADPLYGFEPDLTLGVQIMKAVKLQAGASIFVPIGPGLGRGSTPTPWGYLQLAAAI